MYAKGNPNIHVFWDHLIGKPHQELFCWEDQNCKKCPKTPKITIFWDFVFGMGIGTDTMQVCQDSGFPARLSQKRPFLERQMIPGCTNVGITPNRLDFPLLFLPTKTSIKLLPSKGSLKSLRFLYWLIYTNFKRIIRFSDFCHHGVE